MGNCGAGYYNTVDGSSNPICLTCSSSITGCTTCSKPGSNVECTVCAAVGPTPYYLKGTTCVGNCGAGYYNTVDGSSNPICLTCSSSITGCTTCSKPGSNVECTVCAAVGPTPYYLKGTTCVSDCSDTFFTSTDANSQPICRSCLNICQTCDNPNTCLSCKSGHILVGGIGC